MPVVGAEAASVGCGPGGGQEHRSAVPWQPGRLLRRRAGPARARTGAAACGAVRSVWLGTHALAGVPGAGSHRRPARGRDAHARGSQQDHRLRQIFAGRLSRGWPDGHGSGSASGRRLRTCAQGRAARRGGIWDGEEGRRVRRAGRAGERHRWSVEPGWWTAGRPRRCSGAPFGSRGNCGPQACSRLATADTTSRRYCPCLRA